MGKIKIELPKEELKKFCEKWQIKELALFGSALREDFWQDSDIDVLVTFNEGARHTLFDLFHIEEESSRIFGREVDLVSRRGIEASRNYIRRKAILSSAEAIYVS
ncbi:MAG: nucleotidyltransferase domain-containing protein [bacterium]